MSEKIILLMSLWCVCGRAQQLSISPGSGLSVVVSLTNPQGRDFRIISTGDFTSWSGTGWESFSPSGLRGTNSVGLATKQFFRVVENTEPPIPPGPFNISTNWTAGYEFALVAQMAGARPMTGIWHHNGQIFVVPGLGGYDVTYYQAEAVSSDSGAWSVTVTNRFGSWTSGQFWMNIIIPRENAPSSIAGDLIQFTISSGSPPFASSGTFYFQPTSLGTYTIGSQPGFGGEFGSYVYQKTGASTATVTYDDVFAGFGYTSNLNWTSPTNGTYSLYAPATGGTESGTFRLE